MTMSLWAHYRRHHSPLLLQIRTTNNVESWHRSLKGKGYSSQMSRFSLEGLLRTLHEVAVRWDRKAELREAQFRTKNLSEAVAFPPLRLFPFPIQKLLTKELRHAQQLINDCMPLKPSPDPRSCSCDFWKSYNIPCRHIWQRELKFGVIRDEDWTNYADLFDEAGFEVYETLDRNIKIDPIQDHGEQNEIDRQTLAAREQWDQLRSKWYELCEESNEFTEQERAQIRRRWVEELCTLCDPLLRTSARQLLLGFKGINRDEMVPRQEGDEVWEGATERATYMGIETIAVNENWELASDPGDVSSIDFDIGIEEDDDDIIDPEELEG